jgi:hypothetical protein
MFGQAGITGGVPNFFELTRGNWSNRRIGMNGKRWNLNSSISTGLWSQFMFEEQEYVKDRNDVFHLVWTYKIKDAGRKKACCACDGSSRGGKTRILDYTHANCVDHTASRMFYAIAAAENLKCYSGDVSNAFAEAPALKQGFWIQPDRAFHEW